MKESPMVCDLVDKSVVLLVPTRAVQWEERKGTRRVVVLESLTVDCWVYSLVNRKADRRAH
jgi:hypothetical protein